MMDQLRAHLDDDDRRRGPLDPAVLPMDRSTRLIVQSLLHILERLDQMTIDQKALADAITAEGADVDALVAAFTALTAAVDKLLATPTTAPDFQPQFDAVAAERAKLAATLSSVNAERAKLP